MACSSPNDQAVLDVLLKCALCNGDLLNTQPKSFPCLHTFCTSCLTNKSEQFELDTNNFKCPICNTSVGRSSEDAEITSNLKLDVIIEKLLHVRNLQKSERRCEMCPVEQSVVSDHWCLDCGKFICDPCLVNHEKYKPKDKVIDLGVDGEGIGDMFLISPPKCTQHKKRFKMYCEACENCLCSTCILENHLDTKKEVTLGHFLNFGLTVGKLVYHGVRNVTPRVAQRLGFKNMECEPKPIVEEYEKMEEQGQKLLIEMRLYLYKQRQEIESMETEIDLINLKNKEACVKICEQTEEVIEMIKKKAHAFVAELETKAKKETTSIQERIKIKQENIEKMEIIEIFSSQLLQHFDIVNILMNFPRLEYMYWDLYLTPSVPLKKEPTVELNYDIMFGNLREILLSHGSRKAKVKAAPIVAK